MRLCAESSPTPIHCARGLQHRGDRAGGGGPARRDCAPLPVLPKVRAAGDGTALRPRFFLFRIRFFCICTSSAYAPLAMAKRGPSSGVTLATLKSV